MDVLDNMNRILSEKNPSPETALLQDGIKKVLSNADPTPENIVLTFNLNCKLDLKTIASKHPFVLYDPKSFDALIMRVKKSRTTVLLSASGKAVCTGGKTEYEAKNAADLIAIGLETKNLEGGYTVIMNKDRTFVRNNGGKSPERGGVCVPGIAKCFKRLLVTLGLMKNSRA